MFLFPELFKRGKIFYGMIFLGLFLARPCSAHPLRALSVHYSAFRADKSFSHFLFALRAKNIARKRTISRNLRTAGRVWPTQQEWRILRWRLASRGGFDSLPFLDMEATAYDPGPISCGPHANGHTATGMLAGYGVAAVDPRVIPLGTRLYVEGYGYAIAADVGSAIKGNRIDLCFNKYQEAVQYGRRQVRVYVLYR